MEKEKKRSIFRNTYVIAILAGIVVLILHQGLEYLKKKFSLDMEIIWVLIVSGILLIIILLCVDWYKSYKTKKGRIMEKLNSIEMIVLDIQKRLNMGKKGQYQYLIYFLVVVVILLLVIYFLKQTNLL